MEIFGVKIPNQTKNQIKNIIHKAIYSKNSEPIFIVTLNPEILLLAGENLKYQKILNQAELKIIDGFGIKFLSWLKNGKISERFTGADLLNEFILENKNQLNFGFVISDFGLSSKQEVKKALVKLGFKKDFFQITTRQEIDDFCEIKSLILKNCEFVNNERGNNFKEKKNFLTDKKKQELSLEKFIQKTQILIVALGAPRQEIFIDYFKNKFPNLKLAVGVGGAVDFITGKQKRAPKILRRFGLEWFWRLMFQPKRFFRIWRATVLFLFRGLFEKYEK